MAKYYVLLGLAFVAVMLYIFLQDPCGNNVRSDFLEKYPDYEIVFFGAGESAEEFSNYTVRCHIRYRIPEGIGTYEDVWEYRKADDGWKLSRVLEEHKMVE